ncbi:hypothetical protein ACHAWF_005832 [Thalassiosira exigua]
MDISVDQLSKKKKIVLVGKDLDDGDLGTLAEVIEKSEVLEEINLMCNKVTLAEGKFVDALAKSKSLKNLSLYNNRVGPEGAERLAMALRDNRTLEQLFLEGNELGDKGAQYLAGALTTNKKLQCIILRGNEIGDAGAEALANMLVFNRSLTVMLLGENKITNAGATKLAGGLEYNAVMNQLLLDANPISPILDLKIKTVLASSTRKQPQESRALPKQIVEAMIAAKDEELVAKDAEKQKALAAKDVEIEGKDRKILRRETVLKAKVAELIRKDEEIAQLKKNLSKYEKLRQQVRDPIKLLQVYMKAKDAEIASLKSTIDDIMRPDQPPSEVAASSSEETGTMEAAPAQSGVAASSSEETGASLETGRSEETGGSLETGRSESSDVSDGPASAASEYTDATDHTNENRPPAAKVGNGKKDDLRSPLASKYLKKKKAAPLE